MRQTKFVIFALSMVAILSACQSGGKQNKNITLISPENTTMLTDTCKAYVDAMRKQQEDLKAEGLDIYKYNEKFDKGISVESYLDKGGTEGKNQTVSGAVPDRSDKNIGVDLKFEVKEGAEVAEYKVLVSTDNKFENAKEYVTNTTSINVNNLFVNTKYYWKVVTEQGESAVSDFTTADYPRWITARPMYNVRDTGGYMTYSGKRVKQGIIFRGGEITNKAWSEHLKTNAESSKKAFREDMGMVGGLELDLRGTSDIGDGYKACAFAENGDIAYVMHAIKSYEQTFTNTRSEVAKIFKDIYDRISQPEQKHIYYHCYGGADRTGTLGFLINGLLGVSYTDLAIDFELTSYSSINNEHIRNRQDGHQHQYDRWPALIKQLKTDKTNGYAWDDNALLKDNIANFLKTACKVDANIVDAFPSLMLED